MLRIVRLSVTAYTIMPSAEYSQLHDGEWIGRVDAGCTKQGDNDAYLPMMRM